MTPLPRPYPNAADRAEADRLLPELFPAVDRAWLNAHRDDLIAGLADAVMAKRLNEEAKAIREHNGRVMGSVSGRCAAPRRRSAGLWPEPVPVSALRAAATNARKMP